MKRINWIDAVAILLVVALCAGGVWYLNRNKSAKTDGGNTKAFVTVEVARIEKAVADSYREGEQVTIGASNQDSGVISKVEITPYYQDVANPVKGVYETYETEGFYNAYVTLEIDAVETETSVSANEEFSIGADTSFHGKGFAGFGYIVSVSTEKAGE